MLKKIVIVSENLATRPLRFCKNEFNFTVSKKVAKRVMKQKTNSAIKFTKSYIEKRPLEKYEKFNLPVSILVHSWSAEMRHNCVVYAMEAAGAMTSREIIKRGVPCENICAFTYNKDDFKEINGNKLGIAKQFIHSTNLYRTKLSRLSHNIIVHDATYMNEKTFEQVSHLFRRRFSSFDLICNVSMRGVTPDSQIKKFNEIIVAYAKKKFYETISQGSVGRKGQMWAVWFRFKRMAPKDRAPQGRKGSKTK